MGRKKRRENKDNLNLVIIFCIFVFFLVFISLSVKIISIIGRSSFDGNHRFTISIGKHNSNMSTEIVSVSPETQVMTHIAIPNLTISQAQKRLEIPIDGEIVYSNGDKIGTNTDFGKAIINYNSISTNLTIIDLIRLWLVVKTIPASNQKEIVFDSQESDLVLDKMSYSLLSDYSVIKEKLSIQIVNGTDISGLGTRLARFITNMGGNVVEVSTSDNSISKSQITSIEGMSYTASKLSKVLNFPLEKNKKGGVSDIVIIIGKDKLQSFVF